MKIDGSCHCGKIRFEGDTGTADATLCHCADCQTLTGAAFRVTVPVEAHRFRILAGEPRIYVKTADSGARRAQAFCDDCGTPIYATSADGAPKIFGVRVGTLRQRADLIPTAQIWRGSALPWVPAMSELATWEAEDE